MKILKVFGVVAGIHLFALLLIFANPGCSSTAKRPTVADTMPASSPAPVISVPSTAASPNYVSPIEPAPLSAAAPAPALITFNPDAPAAPASASAGSRIMPTRPDTPVASVLTSEGEKGFTAATTYTVKSGDNLWTIAKKNGLSVSALTAANSLSNNASLKPGQKLIIPSKAVAPSSAPDTVAKTAGAAPAAGTAARAPGEAVKHTVRSGEVLGTIARAYGVSVGDIAVANNISDPAKIPVGKVLVIPNAKSSSKSAKSAAKPAADATAKAGDAKAPFTLQPVATPEAEPTPAPAPIVPVIKIDEGPAQPAPQPAPKF
ncbi:MAG: LysM peptidoglycan-binding domain-containing protein [Opitutaceae bacterium]|nr:LysM peptidoglycan-binding domain-containing protein [Opitutaceae bacterium]